IKAMADYYDVEKIGDMAQSLADMFRYNIKNKDEMVTLREELEQIDSYMKIQGIRFEDKITYIQEIEDDVLDYPLLKMTLQPIVENAVFHGVEPKIGKSTIRLIAHKEGESLIITVSDDGVGISADNLKALRNELKKQHLSEEIPVSAAGGGIGIRNVYARYAIRLSDQFECKIESEMGKGTRVTLFISSWNLLRTL
ncbi:sensor histidine kinase, partial [Paenibacillus sp. TAF58]